LEKDKKTEEMLKQNQLLKGNDHGKRPFTFDYSGDIIMIRKPNPDSLQQLIFQPKATDKKPQSVKPPDSIHKFGKTLYS